MQCLSGYFKIVNDRYPKLIYNKVTVLKSYPQAISQYEGCGNKLHTDYDESVNHKEPNERPLSMIVAIDPFQFKFLPQKNGSKKTIVDRYVSPGEMILFTNNCYHAGGANNTENQCIRLFAYIVSDIKDFPDSSFRMKSWAKQGDDSDDDILDLDS